MSEENRGSPEQHGELEKQIGVFSGSNILIGIMIGSGIFYLGSYVMQRSNMSMGFSMIAWIVGGLITLLGGICFAELGAMMPEAGGLYVYLSEAYSPMVGFMKTFTSVILSGAGSIAAVGIAFPTALNALFTLTDFQIKAIAIASIIIFTIINIRGVKLGTIVQNIFTVAKILPLVAIIILGLTMGKQTPDLSLSIASDMSVFAVVRMVAFTVIATLWAYEGWTNLNSVAGEMKNPQKNLPRAIILAVVITTGIYLLFNFAIFKVLPQGTIETMIGNNDLYLGTEVANVIFGDIGRVIVSITMSLAMIGSLNGMILAFPREYYAVAKAGFFFDKVGELHPKYNTPYISLLIQMVISIILVLSRNLDQLTSLVVFSGSIFNVLIILAVPILRKKYPDMERPYKVWFYPVTVILATAAFIGVLLSNLLEDPKTSILGLAVPAIGALCFLWFKKQRDKK